MVGQFEQFGTLSNLVTGIMGNGLYIDGTNNFYLAIKFTNTFMVEHARVAWASPITITSSDQLAMKTASSTCGEAYAIAYDPSVPELYVTGNVMNSGTCQTGLISRFSPSSSLVMKWMHFQTFSPAGPMVNLKSIDKTKIPGQPAQLWACGTVNMNPTSDKDTAYFQTV